MRYYPTRAHKDSSWMVDAACKGAPLNLFFPELGDPTPVEAKRICGTCPVQVECLEYAQTSPLEREGVWGGKSRDERKKLRAR